MEASHPTRCTIQVRDVGNGKMWQLLYLGCRAWCSGTRLQISGVGPGWSSGFRVLGSSYGRFDGVSLDD